jgi:hypothetical protein
MPTDPKWRTIARTCSQAIPSVIAVYLFMLVNASNADERGRTQNLIAEDIASALDLDVETVESILLAMEGRVIEDGVITGWVKRQPIREDNAAERARIWRERKRTHANADERPDKTRGDKKNQVPSRDKREVDPRHVLFKDAVDKYADFKGVELPWDGSEAKALALLLNSLPQMTVDDFKACLNNRAKSPGIPHGERPRVWLPHIAKYQQGPLNEFGKTGEGNGKFAGKTESSLDAAQQAIAIFAQREAAGYYRPIGEAGGEASGEAGSRRLLGAG